LKITIKIPNHTNSADQENRAADLRRYAPMVRLSTACGPDNPGGVVGAAEAVRPKAAVGPV